MIKRLLIILPQLGGGTTRHAREMSMSWMKQGVDVIYLETIGDFVLIKNILEDNICVFDLRNNKKNLIEYLKGNVQLIHYHHFIRMNSFWLELPYILRVPYYVTLHDYYTVCPSIKMLRNGTFCNNCSVVICNRCIENNFIDVYGKIGEVPFNINRWRNKWRHWLRNAEKIFVPSKNAKENIIKYFPDIEIEIFSNPELIKMKKIQYNDVKQDDVKVGLVGDITPPKGADILVSVANLLCNDNNIVFYVFGSLKSSFKSPKNIKIMGRYNENDVSEQIRKEHINYFWFPAIWPETYSYTLTIPLLLGLPVIGADIGAIGERIKKNCVGEVYNPKISIKELSSLVKNFNAKKYICAAQKYKPEVVEFPNVCNFYDKYVDADQIATRNKKVSKCFNFEVCGNVNVTEFRKIFKCKIGLVWKIKLIKRVEIRCIIGMFLYKFMHIFNLYDRK